MNVQKSSTSYSKLKTHYQNNDVVGDYEKIRFQNIPGRIFEYLQKRSISKVISKLDGVSTILDLPCGTGRLMRFLSAKGCKVTGFDISEAMLRYASEKAGVSKQFARGSAENLCFRDSSFDCVISFRFFCHIDSDVRVEILKEMKRVSKKWVIITNAYLTPYTRLRRKLKEIAGLNSGHWRPVKFAYTEDLLRKEIESAGLRLYGIAWTQRMLSEEAFFILERI